MTNFSFKEALEMPLATVSKRILCKDMLPLFPVSSLLNFQSCFPVSVSYYQVIFLVPRAVSIPLQT